MGVFKYKKTFQPQESMIGEVNSSMTGSCQSVYDKRVKQSAVLGKTFIWLKYDILLYFSKPEKPKKRPEFGKRISCSGREELFGSPLKQLEIVSVIISGKLLDN